jgi:hypothetical protein
MELHPEVSTLLAAMRELEQALDGRANVWAERVRKAADEVAASDAHGLQRFLGFFGGMGSLNDLILHRDGEALVADNDRLDAARKHAWRLASDLRRETDKP